MKRSLRSNALLLFLLILISISKISARSIATQKGQEKVKLNEISTSGGPDLVKLESSESMNQLMGVEDCNEGDEECFQRRIVSEAHLDYIYTQHHKP
ncbi:putative phytosulfokines 6 isoform X1 [Juglans regia]|uniref:Phytosulfokine n=2 Tax=Juglans regia TaxID=51240 RepID=A0A2I4FNF0_JUGRE|nr:putative phytosulfokines 6 isoform X1 [Juglans regia]